MSIRLRIASGRATVFWAMAGHFNTTLRTLDAERTPAKVVHTVLALFLLAAWPLWFFFDEIALYETSTRAQLVVEGAAHTMASPRSGRLLTSKFPVGQEVREGQILAQLDSAREQLELAERNARLATLEKRLDVMDFQVAIEAQAMDTRLSEEEAIVGSSQARIQAREAFQRVAEAKLKTGQKLGEHGYASPETLAA